MIGHLHQQTLILSESDKKVYGSD
ncbi:unnamed protein product [Victoria cruziana]